MVLELAIMLVFPALMILAAVMDVFTMTIPNRIALGLAAGFAFLAPFSVFGWETIALHAAVGAAVLVIGVGLFAAGWVGGGDVKIFAATSLWMGPEHLYQFALATAICGGVLTLFMLGLRSFPLPAGLVGQKWLARLHEAGGGVPYGVAISAGALIVYPYTGWVSPS